MTTTTTTTTTTTQAAGNLFDNDWVALFEKCDTRGEGALDLADFINALRNVCRLTAKMLPKVQIKEVFEAVDLDHGGDIDVEEFTKFLDDDGGGGGSDDDSDGDSDTLGTPSPFGSEVDLEAALRREEREQASAAAAAGKKAASSSSVATTAAVQFRVGDEVEARCVAYVGARGGYFRRRRR